MLQLLFTLGASRDPIILVPGMMGSKLSVSYNRTSYLHCPPFLNESLFWINYSYITPFHLDCLVRWLEPGFDTKKTEPTAGDWFDVSTVDYGGIEGVVKLDDTGLFGKTMIMGFDKPIKYLENHGYQVKKDLFTAPYDWRRAGTGLSTFNPELKELVENAFNINEGKKVTILGYSLGGLMVNQFLTEYIDQSWKDKYLERVIYLAPAITGSSFALSYLWDGTFPFISTLKLNSVRRLLSHLGSLYVLLPNYAVYQNEVFAEGPNGNKYTSKQLFLLLAKNSKLYDDVGVRLLNMAQRITGQFPKYPGIPTYIYYNSAISTEYGLDLTNGYNKESKRIYSKGDGTIPSKGIEILCKKWGQTNKSLKCHDFKNRSSDYNHNKLGTNDVASIKIFETLFTN